MGGDMKRTDILARAAASLIMAAAPFAFAACGSNISTAGDCTYDGKTYAVGDSFPDADGCNTCSCTDGGGVACTEVACAASCEWNGESHAEGDTFPSGDGCNNCQCESDGTVSCTLVDCVSTCEYGGKTYQYGQMFQALDGCNLCTCGELIACTMLICGEPLCSYDNMSYVAGMTFPATDGCNTCTCLNNGQVSCTEIACAPVCTYASEEYKAGETFPANDGCNTCSCTAAGVVSCTTMTCACDPSAEWWRHYVSTDPAECQLIDFGCPPNTMGFENGCGCGCQQDPACPEYYDCMPPAMCDVQKIMETCPYSGIVF